MLREEDATAPVSCIGFPPYAIIPSSVCLDVGGHFFIPVPGFSFADLDDDSNIDVFMILPIPFGGGPRIPSEELCFLPILALPWSLLEEPLGRTLLSRSPGEGSGTVRVIPPPHFAGSTTPLPCFESLGALQLTVCSAFPFGPTEWTDLAGEDLCP